LLLAASCGHFFSEMAFIGIEAQLSIGIAAEKDVQFVFLDEEASLLSRGNLSVFRIHV
jgi:hypothetical protein